MNEEQPAAQPAIAQPAIRVEVVDGHGEQISFRGSKLPDFRERAAELGESLNVIAAGLRDHLSELAAQRADGWDLEQVALSFSLSLQASGGVLIAQASTTAGFQATLTWHRAEPTRA